MTMDNNNKLEDCYKINLNKSSNEDEFYSSDSDNNSENSLCSYSCPDSEFCPICLLKFKKQAIGIPDACDHQFCLDCLLEWSSNVNTCPIDRRIFSIIYVKSLNGVFTEPIPINKSGASVVWSPSQDRTFCEICSEDTREDQMLLCDACDLGYHLDCLIPPLRSVPPGEWFCPDCNRFMNSTLTSHLNDCSEFNNNNGYHLDLDTSCLGNSLHENKIIRCIRRKRKQKVSKKKAKKRISRKKTKHSLKKKISKQRQKCIQRDAINRNSIRAKLACQLQISGVTKGYGLPIIAPHVNVSSNILKERSFIPSLSLFGHSDELNIISEDDENETSSLSLYLESAQTSSDLLGDIMKSQELLYSSASDFIIECNGTLKHIKENQVNIHSVNQFKQCNSGEEKTDDNSKTVTVKSGHVNAANVDNKLNYESGNSETNNSDLNYYNNVNKNENDVLSVINVYNEINKKEEEESDVDIYSDIDMQKHEESASLLLSKQLMTEEQLSDINELSDVSSTNDLIIDERSPTNCASDFFETSSLQNEQHLDTSDLHTYNRCQTNYDLKSNDLEEGEIDEFITEKSKNSHNIYNENKDDSGSSIEDEEGEIILKLKERCIEIGAICNDENEEQVFWKRRKSKSHNRNYRDGRTNAIQELSKKEKYCHDSDFSLLVNKFGKSNNSCESSNQEQIMHRKKRQAVSDFKESSEHQKKKKSSEQKSKEPTFENEEIKERQYNNKKSSISKNIKTLDKRLELASTLETKEQLINVTTDNEENDISLNYKLSKTNKKGTEYHSERKEKNDRIHYNSKDENTKPKNYKLSPVNKETQNFIKKAKSMTDGKLKAVNNKNKSKVSYIDNQFEEKFQTSNYTDKHHIDNCVQSVIKEVYQHGNKIIVNVNFETPNKINERTVLENNSHKHKKINQKEKLINESQKISESSKQKLVNVKENSNSVNNIKMNMKSKKEKELKSEVKADDTKKKNSDYASKILQSGLHSSQKQHEQKFSSIIKSREVKCEISSNKTHRRRKDSKKSKSSRSRSSSQERKEGNYKLKSDLKFINVNNQKVEHKIKNKKGVLPEHPIAEVCKPHSFRKENCDMLSKKKSIMKVHSDSNDEKKLPMHKNSVKQKLKDKNEDKIMQLHSPRKKKKSEKYLDTENLKQRTPLLKNCKHYLKASSNSSFSESESEKAPSLSSISSPSSSQKYLLKPPVVFSSSATMDNLSNEFKKCSANKHTNEKKSDDKIEIIELSSFSDSDSDIIIINKNMTLNTEQFAHNSNMIEVKADSNTETLSKNSEENNNSKEIESEPIIKFSICSRSNLKIISNPLASPESQTSANNLSTIKECSNDSTEPTCKIFVNKNLKESKTTEHNTEAVNEKNKFINIPALNIKETTLEKFAAYDPFDPTDSPDGTPVSNNFDMFSFSNVESPISDSDKDKDCKFPIIQNNNSKITLYDSDCFSNNQVLSNDAANISKQSSAINNYYISNDCQTIPLPHIPPPPTIDNVLPSQMFKPNLISCQTISPCVVKQSYHRLSEASCIPYPNLNQPPPPLPVCNKDFTNMFSQPPPKLNVINETNVSKTRFHKVLFKPLREKMNTSDEIYKDSDSSSSAKFQSSYEQKLSVINITPVQCQSNKDQIVVSSIPVVEATSDFKKTDVNHTPYLSSDKNILQTISDSNLEKVQETNEKNVNKKTLLSSLSHKVQPDISISVDDKRNLETLKDTTYYNQDINYYSVNELSAFKISSSSSRNQDFKKSINNFNLSYDDKKLRQNFQLSEENRNEIIFSRDSPVSPDSNEGEDLFNPPSSEEENSFLKHQSPPSPKSNESSPVLAKNHKSKSSMKVSNNRLSIEDRFEALFGYSPSKGKKRKDSYEIIDKNDGRVKSNANRGKMKNSKTNVRGTKVQDMKLTGGKDFHLVDDIPSSAVELQVKEKYLKKLCLQETVVQEVKVILKPLYNKREIDKEMYKEILRKSVPKICHSKSNSINHSKLEHLIIGYVKKLKYEKSHKHRKLNSKHSR